MAESDLNEATNSMDPEMDNENGRLESIASEKMSGYEVVTNNEPYEDAQMDDANGGVEVVVVGETNVSEVEPYEGMVFESEEAAKSFYDEYAGRLGFLPRALSSRKSGRDGSIISRGFGCRAGSENQPTGQIQRRYTCSAMILLKKDNQGKWVVKKFVRDHNHPLVAQLQKCRRKLDEKDKKIQELTSELRAKKRLSAAYREQLTTFMKDIEHHNEHLSSKVQLVFDNLKKLDAERRELLAQK